MLDEKAFYQYFYNLNDELYSKRKELEKRIKNNPYDYSAFDMLQEIHGRLEQSKSIYDDLKGFYEIDKRVLDRLTFGLK